MECTLQQNVIDTRPPHILSVHAITSVSLATSGVCWMSFIPRHSTVLEMTLM